MSLIYAILNNPIITTAIESVLTPGRLAEILPAHAAWQKHNGEAKDSTRAERIITMRISRRWHEARDAVRDEFITACEWKIGKWFYAPQLARGSPVSKYTDSIFLAPHVVGQPMDHPEHCRRARVPTAIIVHVYEPRPWRACHEFAAVHGLSFITLPWSWYFPTGTTAGIYLRHLADVVPLRRSA